MKNTDLTVTDVMKQRLLQACLMIEEDLSTDLSVARLAQHAEISPFHFQRLFRAMVGESLAVHVLRLRVERAMVYLRDSTAEIQEIAAGSGFRTASGFTRAFTKAIGISPAMFRSQRQCRPWLLTQENKTLEIDRDALRQIPLTVLLEETPEFRVVFERHIGSPKEIILAWNKLLDWANQNGLISSQTQYFGLHLDEWITDDAHARYDACLTVPPGVELPETMATRIIPAGLCAKVFVHGSYDHIDKIWRMFYEEWLPASGYQLRTSYVIDEYDPGIFEKNWWNKLRASLSGIKAHLMIPVTTEVIPIRPAIDK